MIRFSTIVDAAVIAGVFYLTFIMALAGWLRGLRGGEAVTLLPETEGRARSAEAHIALAVISLAVSALFFYLLWIPLPIPLRPLAVEALRIIGLALFVVGLWLIVWARRTLGAMWGISTSRKVQLVAGHQLVQHGPYAFVRHPMYFGWWVALLGLILIYHTWILIAMLVMSLAIFYRRARREEAVLAERFRDEWSNYVARTRFLVPFIY